MATGTIQKLMPTDIGVVRPNLLDNWYFVGGGSQHGAGYFPINSKGQTVYTTANAICIDRWTAASTSVTLRGWGMEIQSSNSNENVTQVLDGGFDAFAGKTLTFSAIVNDGLVLRTFTVGTTQPSGYTIYGEIGDIPKVKVRFVWATNPNAYRLQFVCSDTGGVTYTVKAAKLELGDSQTLAHQVNGSWVLNEVPNYEVELLKCSDSGNNNFVDTSYYRKMGNLCVLTFRSSSTITTGATNEWKSIGTLPNGYRPTDRTYGVVGAGSYNGTYYATVKIESWGDVSVCCTQAANVASLSGTVTFFTS